MVTFFITGVFMWLCYSPSAQTAWESVFYMQEHIPGGWILRGIHHWMAQMMVPMRWAMAMPRPLAMGPEVSGAGDGRETQPAFFAVASTSSATRLLLMCFLIDTIVHHRRH